MQYNQPNIWRHTSLQHDNQSLGSFFRFRYSQTLGVYRPLPTLPRPRRLFGELHLRLVCCTTTSDGQRQRPIALTAATVMAARQPRRPWRQWCPLQRHHHLSGSGQLHLVASLPQPLDRHRLDVAGFWGVNVQQPSPPAMRAGAFPYGLPPQQVGPTFALPVAPPPPAAWTPWMSSRHQQPQAHSFHTMMMVPPTVTDWVADSSASNHTTFNVGNLTFI
jgi:hypothetical protein